MTARKEAHIILELSPESALRIAEEGLSRLGAAIQSREAGTIVAKKGMSFKSWGEDITISVSSQDASRSAVRIISESSLKTTFIDWGANASNVEQIVRGFQSARADAAYA